MSGVRLITLLYIMLISCSGYAQLGGSFTFAFLNLPTSARVSALGGTQISLRDNDAGQGFQNPALYNSSMHNMVATSIVNYFSDIHAGQIMYVRKWKKKSAWAAGVQYIQYGNIKAYDENANPTGTYKAGEQAFLGGYSFAFSEYINFGANLKFVASNLSGYISNALLVDAGIHVKSKDSLIQGGLVLRNNGSQMQTYYTGAQKESIPFEIQAGIMLKPKHMPLRIFMTGTQLQTRNTTFLNPNKPKKFDLDSGIEIPQTIPITAKIFSHITFGGEFIIGKYLNLRLGYNYRQRREMNLEDVRSINGFSWGFGIQANAYTFSYGNAIYHTGQSIHQFSLNCNFNKIKLRKY